MMQAKTTFVHSWVNGFWEYTPDNWDKKTPLPLIVFFHGIGETYPKKSLQSYSDVGLPLKIKQTGMPQDCIVFMPQLNRDWAGSQTVQAIIDWAKNNYIVDTNRIYLTGLSMGGGTIMDFGESGRLSEIAAMVPVCAASWYNTKFAQRYIDAKMPMQFYHGDADTTVNIGSSRSWVDGLNNLNIAPKAVLNVVANAGHNCWDYTYNNAAMWSWLFAQTRATASTPTLELTVVLPGKTYNIYSDNTWK